MILSFCLFFFCMEEGLGAIKKASLSRQKQETHSKTPKRSLRGRHTLALKKTSRKSRSASKAQMGKRSSVKNTNFKKTKRKIASIQSTGYKVSDVKRGSLFEKMKVKKNDVIRFIEGQPVDSKKQIHQMLSRLSKKKKMIDFFITRNKTDFLISYKVDSFKEKKRLLISNIRKIKTKGILAKKSKKIKKRGLAAAQHKAISPTKQSQSGEGQNKGASKMKKRELAVAQHKAISPTKQSQSGEGQNKGASKMKKRELLFQKNINLICKGLMWWL